MYGRYNLWPYVDYYTCVGFKKETYELDKDSVQKAFDLVKSWRKTALRHGFDSPAISEFSFRTIENGHELIYSIDSQPNSIRCKVQKIKVEINVDAKPENTSISLTIHGKHLDYGNTFNLNLVVYRYPEIKTQISNREGLGKEKSTRDS